MKLKVSVIFAAILPLLLSSCGNKEEYSSDLKPGIYLTAKIPGADVHAMTKSGEGVVALNENVLKSVYYFIYKTSEVDANPATAMPKLSGHFSGLESETATTGTMNARHIPISAGIIADLFPSGTKDCRIVLVANPTASLTTVLEGDPSIDALRKSIVTANFATTQPQESFVMVYDDIATVSGRTDSVVAEVDAELIRLADKITVTAKVLDGFYDSESGWYVPVCDGLKVTFVNGFSKTNLMADFESLATTDSDWFDSAETSFGTPVIQTIGENDYYVCSTETPIYSYPMKWDFSEHNEPYLLVELPWRLAGADKNSGTGHITPFYYKFMLSTKSMKANSWYNIELSLKILGSPNKVEPTQQYLYENYQVYDWNNAFVAGVYNNVDADIREARYLVIPETNFILNNQPTWNIPFTSSHECEIVNATYTVTNFSVNPAQQTSPAYINTLSPACTITLNGSVITFNHILRNDISGGAGTYDVSPYDFTFTIRHKDDHSFSQQITIRQYPAIYIDAQLNSYTRTSDGQSFEETGTTVSGWTGTAMFGTVLENNSQAPNPYDNSQGANTSNGNYTFHNQGWIFLIGGNPRGGGLGSNKNGSMYVITTSTAPSLSLHYS